MKGNEEVLAPPIGGHAYSHEGVAISQGPQVGPPVTGPLGYSYHCNCDINLWLKLGALFASMAIWK